MSKCSGGGGKQKASKGKSKTGGGSDTVTRSESLKTSANSSVVTLLRKALHTDEGLDRDLLEPFPHFASFSRNGLQLSIEFKCGKVLDKRDASVCYDMVKAHMEEEYDRSGYGWDDDDKWGEITSRESRLLLLRDETAPDRKVVGFVNFRLTLQGECWNAMEGQPCLFLYDIQIAKDYRRKGVGKQLVCMLEMMAKRAKMSFVCALLTKTNEAAAIFFGGFKGWRDDTPSLMQMEAADTEDDTFKVFAKCLDGGMLKEKAETQQVQELAAQLAALAAAKPPEEAPKAKAAEAPKAKAAEAAEAPKAKAAEAAEDPAAEKSKNAKKKAKQRAKKAAAAAEQQEETPHEEEQPASPPQQEAPKQQVEAAPKVAPPRTPAAVEAKPLFKGFDLGTTQKAAPADGAAAGAAKEDLGGVSKQLFAFDLSKKMAVDDSDSEEEDDDE
jgi:GNAT superfamily N-acetyltransferase